MLVIIYCILVLIYYLTFFFSIWNYFKSSFSFFSDSFKMMAAAYLLRPKGGFWLFLRMKNTGFPRGSCGFYFLWAILRWLTDLGLVIFKFFRCSIFSNWAVVPPFAAFLLWRIALALLMDYGFEKSERPLADSRFLIIVLSSLKFSDFANSLNC